MMRLKEIINKGYHVGSDLRNAITYCLLNNTAGINIYLDHNSKLIDICGLHFRYTKFPCLVDPYSIEKRYDGSLEMLYSYKYQ